MLSCISHRSRLTISLILRKNVNKHMSMRLGAIKFPTYKIKQNRDGVTWKIASHWLQTAVSASTPWIHKTSWPRNFAINNTIIQKHLIRMYI